MQVTRIDPPEKFRVIIAGNVDDARNAVAEWIDDDRPMSEVGKSAWAIHATVLATRAEIDAWYSASHKRTDDNWPVPGSMMIWFQYD